MTSDELARALAEQAHTLAWEQRDDFQREWHAIARELGFPTMTHGEDDEREGFRTGRVFFIGGERVSRRDIDGLSGTVGSYSVMNSRRTSMTKTRLSRADQPPYDRVLNTMRLSAARSARLVQGALEDERFQSTPARARRSGS